MNIKEIEETTGMSRANIRYYESEGLITPARNKTNGYRVYSQQDVDILYKIKLLRILEVSLDEIKMLQVGKDQLAPMLEQKLKTLPEQKAQLERIGEISKMMIMEDASYETMDAERYLHALENGNKNALLQDVKKKLNLPWRRYWARCLDIRIYSLLVTVLTLPFPRGQSLNGLFTLVAMLLMEPLLLHLFATTPGKVIFGIRITDPEEGRLRYGDALVRTWTVMWEGEAMRIPLITMYFQYKSLCAAENGEILPWEWDSELTIRDEGMWRYGLYGAAVLLACTAEVLLSMGG